MSKKGGDLEFLAMDFLELIFKELKFAVVRKRIQLSGSQDGYDNLIEIVDGKYFSRLIYTECKDYTSELNYTDAMIKLPQLASTHENIDLALFLSPRRNFSNIFEETKNKPFLENLADSQFRVAVLSPDTDCMKYFMLYPEIYKRAYGIDAPVLEAVERQEILKQFDKFIFSDKNLQKIVIDEADRETYIGTIEEDSYHIKRTLRGNQKRENDFYTPISSQITLVSELGKNSKGIILLGNPGYGKTSELKQLAVELWNSRESTHTIPFFKSLKNFTVTSRIEEFLPRIFKLIPRLAVIFDGVDEIENIIDFSSKLRSFIEDNKKLFRSKRIKFVISCRTSIYKKYIKNIDDLDIYFLNEVSVYSGSHFLMDKYDLDLEQHRTFDVYRNREILENPFYLDLLGNYFKAHKRLLNSKALLIREFVHSRLDEDRANKFRNDADFDKEQIISYTQKIAFALEAMQKPFLTAGEISRIGNVGAAGLARNSFLEENIADNWSFVLKNIQEYFVASAMCGLDIDDIVKIIKIDSDTDRVHPTWHNVVTFLLNLITDHDVYEALIRWLLDNDFELLFNADSDRIGDEIKSAVLQNFFAKNCIEDNLWINDLKSIALFSECQANIDYLHSAAADKMLHRRARMSALKLLAYMDIPQSYHGLSRALVTGIIKNSEADGYPNLVEDAIMLTKSIGLNADSVFFSQIIELLEDNDEREIVRAIISSAPVSSAIEKIDYFLGLLDKAVGIKNWNSTSKYGSIISTEDNIFALLAKIEDGPLLLKIFEYSIDRHDNHRFKDSLVKEFSGHVKEFFLRNGQYNSELVRIISNAVVKGRAYHYDDDILLDIATSCHIEETLFDVIIESVKGNSGDRHFLAALATKADFEKVLQKYSSGVLNAEFLQQFRNVLSHRNFDLSKRFEKHIESNSHYVFKEKCTKEELDENTEHWRNKEQKEFDVLFDTGALESQIHRLYDFLGKTELGYKDINRFYHKYYKNLELQKNVTVNAKHLLYEILRDGYQGSEKLRRTDVGREILIAQPNIIQDILNRLPKEGKGKNFEISECQKQFIKNWCEDNTPQVLQYYHERLFPEGADDSQAYFVFEAIYKFQKFFHFEIGQELLLNMLWLNSLEDAIGLEYMEGLVPSEKIHERIKFNLTEARLPVRGYCNHLKYCRENNVELQNLNLKDKVYDYLEQGRYYYAGEVLNGFFSSDVKTLEELLNHDLRNKEACRFVYDLAIKLLGKQGREDIARDFLISRRPSIMEAGIYSEQEMIRKLISLNHEDAFLGYYDIINDHIVNNRKGEFEFRNQEWMNFTHTHKLGDLVAVFNLCLSAPDTEKIFGDHYSPLRIAFETIAGICKANDERCCREALEQLSCIDTTVLKAKNVDLFYLNKLKSDIQELAYSHQSKPYKIAEVLKMLDENKYLFS